MWPEAPFPASDSMHPCLNVDEIFRILLCELVDSGAKATAVSLACCCRSFEGPALDVLWRTQHQLLPLLKSFPRDTWKVEAGRFVSLPILFIFLFLEFPHREVFWETSDDRRMGSLPEVRPEDAGAHSECLSGLGNL